MTLATSTRPKFTPGLPLPQPLTGPGPSAAPGLAALGALSDGPEGQAHIRDAIRRGLVRVRPVPGSPDLVIVYPAPHDPT